MTRYDIMNLCFNKQEAYECGTLGSASVAAACLRQDAYILQPPEHATVLLANAQFDWLPKEGKKNVWKPVQTAKEAQQLPNDCFLIVAKFKEENEKKPGHIAVCAQAPRRPGKSMQRDLR